uniref:Uncharacterized protein n=1 Tax=Anopheles maculatus TaxID=74869 RepID=A0A182SG04_9DIPT
MKLKCPSPLCLTSESDDTFRKRLDGYDCLNCGVKKYKSEVYSAADNCASGDTCTKPSRNRPVSFLKRIGGNILHNLGPGHRFKIASDTTQHQVYRAFDEDPSAPSSPYWSSRKPSLPLFSTTTKETITTADESVKRNSSELRAFSIAVSSTSNVPDDHDRCFYRSFHQYVSTAHPSHGNGKYAIERKHKVKKRDLLHKQKQQEFRQERQKQMPKRVPKPHRNTCEFIALNCGTRTGKQYLTKSV